MRHGFDPWVRKILWRRAWQPTPVLLPGESQRSLVVHWVTKSQTWLNSKRQNVIVWIFVFLQNSFVEILTPQFDSINKWGVLKLEPSWIRFSSVQFSSVQSLSCVRLCNSMECSTPGFPVNHQLQKLAQTHLHWVGDAIQPSQPLSSPSPPAFSLSQHQGLFQRVSFSHQVAKVLELQLWHQSFQ